jgi:cytochrome c biogenesis protein CcdA
VVSAVLLAGFLAVFGTFGIIIRSTGITQGDILRYARWPATGIGVALIVLGVALLAGWHLPIGTPRLEAGGRDTTLLSMFLFGVSYAVTSLSCGAAPFISTVVNSFRSNGFASGVYVFVLYGLGMGLVVAALTISMSVAQQGVLGVLRVAMRYADRAAGALVLIVGAYLVYYWGLHGDERSNAVSNLQSRVENWLGSRSVWWVLGVTGVVVTTALVVVLTGSNRTHDSTS